MKHCPEEDESGAIGLRQIRQLGTVFLLLLSMNGVGGDCRSMWPLLQYDSSTV